MSRDVQRANHGLPVRTTRATQGRQQHEAPDPALPQTVAEYAKEAFDNNWMPVGPKPRMMLFTSALSAAGPRCILSAGFWESPELIAVWEFRGVELAMQSDILPAAGWHEKQPHQVLPVAGPVHLRRRGGGSCCTSRETSRHHGVSRRRSGTRDRA
jgi:hypothetical protein